MWTGICRGAAIGAAVMAGALTAPTGAIASSVHPAAAAAPPGLTAHSASTSTPNSNGELIAAANCGENQEAISGGFRSAQPLALVGSYASLGWTAEGYGEGKLTTYAYCAPDGGKIDITDSAGVGAPAAQAPANTTATATCTSGYTLFSGGFEFLNGPSEANSSTFRDYSPSAGTWTVMSAFTSDQDGARLGAVAACGKGLTVKARSSASKPIAAHGGGASATASCHKGETLLSGGFTTTPTPDFSNATGPDTYFKDSYRSAARSWTVKAVNYSAVAGAIRAFAYCAT